MQQYFTYLLHFTNGSYYVGVTNDIERRMNEHRTVRNPGSYVEQQGNFELVHVESFPYILKAIAREKQLKNWSKAKKDALVAGDENALFYLAKKDFSSKKKIVRPSAPSRSEERTED